MSKSVKVSLVLTVPQAVELRRAVQLAYERCRDELYGSKDPDSFEWRDSDAFFGRLMDHLDGAVSRGRGRKLAAIKSGQGDER